MGSGAFDPFWGRFIDWHLRTEHHWDVALHLEAMTMNIQGMAADIGERLLPAIVQMRDAITAAFTSRA